jgi:hypothetical protein
MMIGRARLSAFVAVGSVLATLILATWAGVATGQDQSESPDPAPEARATPTPSPRGDPFRPQEIPEDLDTSWRQVSEARHFQASLRSMTSRPGINRIHNWTVRVTSPSGQPIDDATLAIDGGMPAHNHGFPTRPKVTRHIGNGTYLVEGVKFNMTGWWEFVIDIQAGELSDRVRFNVIVTD